MRFVKALVAAALAGVAVAISYVAFILLASLAYFVLKGANEALAILQQVYFAPTVAGVVAAVVLLVIAVIHVEWFRVKNIKVVA